ncbi:uncharacterized protein LY89DRAFT_715000 [Mollisia scopiformis]|uniref:Uncharacterized protein n=1 Tax=Mollisia scopiformis TaxID=149040 RepID=A0A194XP80_MOLSC|nr:uncharacterized protein LY89DRAFT_715000 [Mollisia scopiformis]KUJ21993.1 hypothetical protein LY89DRAFT_715000 [Mollisia scopiformis]
MSDQHFEIDPPPPLPLARAKNSPTFDLTHPSLVLILYNTLIAIPFSYFIAALNKKIFQLLGYEKIMRCPSGILGTKILFVAVNLLLIWVWVVEGEREEGERRERIARVKEEIAWWDEEIERLEAELESLLGGNESVLNAEGIREWDFVVGAKSPKGKGLEEGGSGLKGLIASSKLPKLRKKMKDVVKGGE